MNMKSAIRHAEYDDVDAIVEAYVSDPLRADDMKKLLRQKMGAPGIVRLFASAATVGDTLKPQADDDADDMWDNVPV